MILCSISIGCHLAEIGKSGVTKPQHAEEGQDEQPQECQNLAGRARGNDNIAAPPSLPSRQDGAAAAAL